MRLPYWPPGSYWGLLGVLFGSYSSPTAASMAAGTAPPLDSTRIHALVKSEEVRAEYSGLHSLLRMAVSVFVLADADAVITDADRTPEFWVTRGGGYIG